MEKLIAICGLNCATCEARIATINNDDELRKATAEKWRTAYNAPDITYEMINCTGCREEGVKIGHWEMCQIQKCATSQGFKTCGDCKKLESCELVAQVHKFAPEAITNLRSLN
ncbi:MAG: DUF3795 domain-containing protein [Bacteroidota bacterium]|nr:DUF3795 domain-containing protein [Bacteroidota bacterium]